MSGREGCLAILLDESVKHYDLAQNQLIIGPNDGTVWADVPGDACIEVRKSIQVSINNHLYVFFIS